MVVKPRVRGFICVTAHPVGCERHVRDQIDYVSGRRSIDLGPKRVLVIGASTGYGLAARITSAFACGADTLGVCFEHPGSATKPGSAGWYNTAAFERFAAEHGRYAKDVNGDAFSDAVKQRVIELIRKDLGQLDLVVYSLAAPRRVDPRTGVVYTSTLKPIGKSVALRTIDTDKEVIKEVVLPPATPSEIENTVAVMGGQDWQMWIEALLEADVLARGVKTTAFTYVGKKITRDIYWDGSIGAAKKDLDEKCRALRDRLSNLAGDARVSVLKAVVTQASSAIPTMPLYLSLLFAAMKRNGTHEGCIEQIYRLYKENLYGRSPCLDEDGRLRVDDRELDEGVQQHIQEFWPKISTDNVHELTDFEGYKSDFLRLFGFGITNVDYDADVNLEVPIPNLVQI
jgi:enoyl-[acyl-carrier protein] reductase / trans-2-enoyl-CoA reductase (NAD+)